MSTLQLISDRDTVMDAGGKNPAIGHKVNIYEPGTLTRITTYKDSLLTVQNTNPVVLDFGKASIWVARDCDVNIEDPDANIIAEDLSANPQALIDISDSGLVPNGSFETDTDADNEPDGWTKTDESGSTNTLDTSQSTDGAQSMQFVSAGSGGGNIITDDFFTVNDVDDLTVSFDIKSNVVDVRNIVRIEWFDSSKVSISNTDVYDNAASNPTSFTNQISFTTGPANARFAKLRLIGCDPSDATPGNTNFDRVRVFYPQTSSGVFDNVTVQNNQIITTNTNGPLEIAPDGVGGVNLTNTDAPDLTDNTNVLNLGALAGIHLALGPALIQGKATATTAGALSINTLGGVLSLAAAAGRVDVLSTLVVALDDNTNALNVGALAGVHVAIGGISIQSKATATTVGQLDLNPLGGDVRVGPQSGAGSFEGWEAGTKRVETDGAGIDVIGTSMDLIPGADSTSRIRLWTTVGGADLSIAVTTGDASISILNNTGAATGSYATFVRGGLSEFTHNGIGRLRTALITTAAIGMGAEVHDGDGNYQPVGMNVTPITGISSNTDLRLANVGQQLRATASLTVDMDATTNDAKNGSKWELVNESGGTISVTATGVTLTWLDGAGGTTGTRTIADGSHVCITKRATSQYQIVGNGIT